MFQRKQDHFNLLSDRIIMEDTLFVYIERLQSMGFFSGYPVVYAFVIFFAGLKHRRIADLVSRWIKLLPVSYALTGTLFVGFILKSRFQDYSFEASEFELSFFTIWGIMSILFWFPLFRKKTLFSLLHSLVFFSLLARDLFIHLTSGSGKEVIKNDMQVYTDSVLLSIATLLLIVLLSFLLTSLRRGYNTSVSGN
jgi:hypothetical protein